MEYDEFIRNKSQFYGMSGFEPISIPDSMFPFQRFLTEWSIRKGRAAALADTGLGKTFMELVWADNVVRHTNKPVLLLTPLAVSHQTLREAEKFGLGAEVSRDGTVRSKGIVITNYQKLHLFDPNDFGGAVCDESSCIKNSKSATKHLVTEFMRRMEYRLLATATAAPNDYHELGTSSEALGYLGYNDMLTSFFKQDMAGGGIGWARAKYRFRGHAEIPFWKWVASWARACRMPSDLGFSDDGYVLPPLTETEVVLECSRALPGKLFAMPASSLEEQRAERKATIRERCEEACRLAAVHEGSSVIWCNLNDEGNLLEKIVPGGVQVSGAMSDDEKEERLLAFSSGKIKTLITKPKIGCWGMNWQHCNNVVGFPTHSYEQYYQWIRRCWRFGQKNPVSSTLVTTAGERGVLDNLRRKSKQADEMFTALVSYMNDAIDIDRSIAFEKESNVPSWL